MTIDGARYESKARHPACRERCIGSGRLTNESPAKYTKVVMLDGEPRLQPVCTCCGEALLLSSVKPHDVAAESARFATGAMPEGIVRWECRVCEYDLRSAKSIRA